MEEELTISLYFSNEEQIVIKSDALLKISGMYRRMCNFNNSGCINKLQDIIKLPDNIDIKSWHLYQLFFCPGKNKLKSVTKINVIEDKNKAESLESSENYDTVEDFNAITMVVNLIIYLELEVSYVLFLPFDGFTWTYLVKLIVSYQTSMIADEKVDLCRYPISIIEYIIKISNKCDKIPHSLYRMLQMDIINYQNVADPESILYLPINYDKNLFRKRLNMFMSSTVEVLSLDKIFALNTITDDNFLERSPVQVILAGGSLFTLISDRNLNEVNSTEDIDIWICGGSTNDRIKMLSNITDILLSMEYSKITLDGISKEYSHVSLKESAFTFVLTKNGRPIQLMVTGAKYPSQIPNNFDLDFTKCYYDGSDIFISNSVEIALEDNLVNIDLTSVRAVRLLKALRYQFNNLSNDSSLISYVIDELNDIVNTHSLKTEQTSYMKNTEESYPVYMITLSDLKSHLNKELLDDIFKQYNEYKNKIKILSRKVTNLILDAILTMKNLDLIVNKESEDMRRYRDGIVNIGSNFANVDVGINDLILSREYESCMNQIQDQITNMSTQIEKIKLPDIVLTNLKLLRRIRIRLTKIQFTLYCQNTRDNSPDHYVILKISNEHQDTKFLRHIDSVIESKIKTIIPNVSNMKMPKYKLIRPPHERSSPGKVDAIICKFKDLDVNKLLGNIKGDNSKWDLSAIKIKGVANIEIYFHSWYVHRYNKHRLSKQSELYTFAFLQTKIESMDNIIIN